MTRVPPAGGIAGAEDRGGASFVSRAWAAHGEPRRARRARRDEDFSAPCRAQRRVRILRALWPDLMSSGESRAGGSRKIVKRNFVGLSVSTRRRALRSSSRNGAKRRRPPPARFEAQNRSRPTEPR